MNTKLVRDFIYGWRDSFTVNELDYIFIELGIEKNKYKNTLLYKTAEMRKYGKSIVKGLLIILYLPFYKYARSLYRYFKKGR